MKRAFLQKFFICIRHIFHICVCGFFFFKSLPYEKPSNHYSTPDLTGREGRSLASQCIKTKIQCTPIVKKTKTRHKQKITTKETFQQPPGSTAGSEPVNMGDLQFAGGRKSLLSAGGRMFDKDKDQSFLRRTDAHAA